MAYENGVNWQPLEPAQRGRHATFGAAIDAAFKDLMTQKNPFFDTLVDRWPTLFPGLPARPGRYEDGKIFLYVRNAPTNFALRAKLPSIRRALMTLDGAPKRLDLRLEIHA